MQWEVRAIYNWWEGDMFGLPLCELHSLMALFNTDVDLLRSPMRQVRQKVDSEMRGLKVQEGIFPAPLSSSSAQSCLQDTRGLIKNDQQAHKDECMKNQGMEGGGFFL